MECEPNGQLFVLNCMIKVLIVTIFSLVHTTLALSQSAKLVKIQELQELMDAPSDKIQVINFWATWCAPCIKELPLFEQAHANRRDVEISLVSVDLDLDPNPEKIYRFIDRKKLKSRVFILDERDPNSWIDKIDKNWSGAIPATLVLNSATGKRTFVEKELSAQELEQLIANVSSNN